MRRVLLVAAAISALGCTPKHPPSTPTPANPPAALPGPPPPPAPPAGPQGLRLGPGALRYMAQQSLPAEQELQGQTQVIVRGKRFFLTAIVVGPADSLGYRL